MPPEPSSPTPSEAPRRGCFGCLATTGLGCGAFGVGALGAVVLFAPSLLGGVLRRVLVSQWNEAAAGRVRLESLELSWTSPVELRGLELDDPDGNPVVALDLTLPPLLTLLDDTALAWTVTADLRTLEIELDEGGGTNLARALAPDPSSGGATRFVRIGSFDSRRGLDQLFDFTLTVKGREALVHAGSSLEPMLRLDTINGAVVHRPGRTEFELGAQIVDGGGFIAKATWGPAWWDGETRLEVDAGGLPTAIADHVFQTDGALEAAVGPELTVVLEADQAFDDRVSLTLNGSLGAELDLDARIDESALVVDGDGRLQGRCRLPEPSLGDLVGGELPAGLRVDAGDVDWEFHSSDLRVTRLGSGRDRRFDPRGHLVFEREGVLELVEDTSAGAARVVHRLVDPRLTLRWSEGGTPRVELIERGGEARVVELEALAGVRRWDLALPGLDSEWLARALGLTGVEDLLDERVDLAFVGSAGAGRFTLAGSEGRSALSGRIEGRRLVSDPGDRAVLTLDLERDHDRAWLRSVLPWYASLAKPAGERPAQLTLTEFSLPFSGELSEVEALAMLDLGTVECVPNSSLARRFVSEEPFEETFGKLSFEVDGPLIRYGSDLELALDGEFYSFAGSHDLRQKMVFLSGEIAARYISDAVEGVEDVMVHVSLHGPPEALVLTVDPQVYEAMKSGLSALLELLADDGE